MLQLFVVNSRRNEWHPPWFGRKNCEHLTILKSTQNKYYKKDAKQFHGRQRANTFRIETENFHRQERVWAISKVE